MNCPLNRALCVVIRIMSVAATTIATAATIPDFSSAHFTRCWDAIVLLRRVLFGALHEFSNIGIRGCLKFSLFPLKNESAFPKHHENRVFCHSPRFAVCCRGIEAATVRIVPEVRNQVPV